MEGFFSWFNLPTIAIQQKSDFNALISREEVVNAIRTLQNRKASPVPDRFGSEFYKKKKK